MNIDYSLLGTSNKRKERESDYQALRRLMNLKWNSIKSFYTKSYDEINNFQFRTIKELVWHAYDTVDLYNKKYGEVGFNPNDLKTWDDFKALPILTKEELIEGFPERVLSKQFNLEFTTRSSGSSGRFVTIAVSPEAIYTDTIQGARQFIFQSGGKYSPTDLALFIYTSPWWVSSIDGEYPNAFIPTTTSPKESIKTIARLKPTVLSTYPTYLKNLVGKCASLKDYGIKLIVVHSEQSTTKERSDISKILNVPVLDEFSSEELTRIALECPNRSYHLEEDACYIEVIEPNTKKVLDYNNRGLIIGTNLLNKAMPIIRYSQGDIGTIQGDSNCECGSKFRILNSPEGRYMDSMFFGNKIVPASCFMDLAYNWYLELDVPIHGLQYQIIQNTSGDVGVFLIQGCYNLSPSQITRIRESFYQLIPTGTDVQVHLVKKTPITYEGKYRPIVSLMDHPK